MLVLEEQKHDHIQVQINLVDIRGFSIYGLVIIVVVQDDLSVNVIDVHGEKDNFANLFDPFIYNCKREVDKSKDVIVEAHFIMVGN